MDEKEIQQLLQQYQTYQIQIQNLLVQKENLKLQLLEIDSALDELESAEGDAYKIVGAVMVKKPVEEIKRDLKDKRGLIDLRIKTLEKTEAKLASKLKDLEKKLEQALKPKAG